VATSEEGEVGRGAGVREAAEATESEAGREVEEEEEALGESKWRHTNAAELRRTTSMPRGEPTPTSTPLTAEAEAVAEAEAEEGEGAEAVGDSAAVPAVEWRGLLRRADDVCVLCRGEAAAADVGEAGVVGRGKRGTGGLQPVGDKQTADLDVGDSTAVGD
jgi:hypothetical protein